jgi:hypothetical protein
MQEIERAYHDVRKAVYDLIWLTAHLYKDAPGGKLTCPMRSQLEKYVDGKMVVFDMMAKDHLYDQKMLLKEIVLTFLKENLEDYFRSFVFEEEEHLSKYEAYKQECLRVLSQSIP